MTLAGIGSPPSAVALSKGLRFQDEEGWSAIFARREAADVFCELLIDPNIKFVIQNASFDMALLVDLVREELGIDLYKSKPSVFDLYDPREGVSCASVTCTKVREMLLSIADDTYTYVRVGSKVSRRTFSLKALTELYYGTVISKGADTWRLRYSELDGLPLEEWPKNAVEYAVDDARWHLRVYQAQSAPRQHSGGGVLVDSTGYVTNEAQQCAADFALHLTAVHGVSVAPKAVEIFEKETQKAVFEARDVGIKAGFVQPEIRKGTVHFVEKRKPLQALVSAAYQRMGEEPPLTPKGAVRTAASVLKESGDPVLLAYSEGSVHRKVLST